MEQTRRARALLSGLRRRLALFRGDLWEDRPRSVPARAGIIVARSLTAVARSLTDGERNRQVGLLTYTTIMTMIPVLAVAFVVFDAFGGVHQLEQQALKLVFRYLTPSDAQIVGDKIGSILSPIICASLGVR